MSCPVLLLSCLLFSCLALSFLSYPVLSFLVLSCPVLSCHILSCLILYYSVLSCPALCFLSCHVVNCHVLPCLYWFVLSCLVLPFPVFLSSWPVLSCPVLSCSVLSCTALSSVFSPLPAAITCRHIFLCKFCLFQHCCFDKRKFGCWTFVRFKVLSFLHHRSIVHGSCIIHRLVSRKKG